MKKLEKENKNEEISEDNMLLLETSIIKLFYLIFPNQVNNLIEEIKEKYEKNLILLRKSDSKSFNIEEYFKMNDTRIRRIIEKKLTKKSFVKDFSQLKMEFLKEHMTLLIRHLISMVLYVEIKTGDFDAFVYIGRLERLENEELAKFLLYY